MSSSQEKSSTGVVSMIYKSRTTLLELLREQNYDVGDYENFGVNEIHAMYTNKDAPKQLDMICSSNTGTTKQKKVYVKYHLGKTLRVENIQDYIDDLFHIDKVLDNKTDTLIILTIFCRSLGFNSIFKKFNIINVKQLPDISRFDPVAQAIGMRPGDICCIERPSKTAIISKYYRYCTQVTL